MFDLTRHSWLLVLVLAVSSALAAEPATKAPEQQIANRRRTIMNGAQRSVYYDTTGLNPLEAVAYRRLEFVENEVERNRDEQQLIRLRVQNDTRAETMAGVLASYSAFGYYQVPRRSSSQYYNSTDFAGPAQQAFEDLKRAYLDVLDLERARLGLPRLLPAAPLPAAPVEPGAAKPGPAIPAPAEPAAAVIRAGVPVAAAPAPVSVQQTQQAVAKALSQWPMVLKAMSKPGQTFTPSTPPVMLAGLQTSTVPPSTPPMALGELQRSIGPPSVPRMTLASLPVTKEVDVATPKSALGLIESANGPAPNNAFPMAFPSVAGAVALVAICWFRLWRSQRKQAAILPPSLSASECYSSSLAGSRMYIARLGSSDRGW